MLLKYSCHCLLLHIVVHLYKKVLNIIIILALYSQVANRRGGRLLIFRNFSDCRSLLGPPAY